jgi:NAD(P)-dependent dehydrogenase (short-subunit alcohol dehydrogenase family)
MSYTWLVSDYCDTLLDFQASRGIGLETIKQLLAVSSNTVFATCGKPDSATAALQSLKQTTERSLHVFKLDVNDEKSTKHAGEVVKGILRQRGLDCIQQCNDCK